MKNPPRYAEYLPLAQLKPTPNNPKDHVSLATSFSRYGYVEPIILDERTGMIIAGHGRVLAARECEIDPIPCITLAGLTEAQRRAYVLADNRLAEASGWDDGMLRLELADLAAGGFDLGLVGFAAAAMAVSNPA